MTALTHTQLTQYNFLKANVETDPKLLRMGHKWKTLLAQYCLKQK